jgi:hypothetical protein
MNSIGSFALVLAACGFAWCATANAQEGHQSSARRAFSVNVEVANAALDEEHIELAGLKFMPAERLKAGGKIIEVESPGYACPGMGDVDGDGKMDLLVGQKKGIKKEDVRNGLIQGGKMMTCKNLGLGKFAKSHWIKTDGEIAVVPGVW